MLFSFLTMDASLYKEYMEFKGGLGSEKIAGGIAMTDSKTFGNFCYYDTKTHGSGLYELICTSCKSLGKGKYQIKFKVEKDGKKYGTWSVTFNSNTRKITGTMKDLNGKSLKIDCYEWR